MVDFVIIAQLSLVYYIVFLFCAHVPMGFPTCRITCASIYLLHVMIKFGSRDVIVVDYVEHHRGALPHDVAPAIPSGL